MRHIHIVLIDGTLLEEHPILTLKDAEFARENAKYIASQGIECFIEYYRDSKLVEVECFRKEAA